MSKKKDSLKPWLSRPAVNRSVTLPLTRPLTQRLSNLNEFHPNELDPYLLFDAQSSMLGTLEASTLDLDPSDPSTLEVITATRAGVATYTDASGNIASAPANTVRVDHVDGVPMILVEPSATNLLPYSEDFGSWSKSDVSLSTGFASPDGLLNARNVTPDATSTTHLFASFGLSSDIKTYSIYAKANGYKYFRFNTGSSGNGFAEFDVEAGTVVGTGGTYYSSSSIDAVGGGWFRCSMTLSAGAANNITIAIEDNSRAVSYLADGVSSLLFWGAQVETGSVSTSYIPTSGGSSAARTRAADDLVISGSAFTDFFNGSEGTIYVEVIDKTPTENSVYVSGQSLNQGFLYSNVDLAIDSYDGANFQRISGVVANELFRAAATYDSTSKKISLNGTTYADGVHNGNWGTATILNIGWGGSGNAGYPQINGHINRLIYWPTHSDNL